MSRKSSSRTMSCRPLKRTRSTRASTRSPPLGDPWQVPADEAFEWVTPPMEAPDTPGYLEVEFSEGIPKAVNGKEMSPVELIRFVNHFAGRHGVGIIDQMEDRLVGIKSREV